MRFSAESSASMIIDVSKKQSGMITVKTELGEIRIRFGQYGHPEHGVDYPITPSGKGETIRIRSETEFIKGSIEISCTENNGIIAQGAGGVRWSYR